MRELKPINDKLAPPFMEIPKEKGYGYYGTLLHDTEENKIQCHVCGELFIDVGKHARYTHKILIREYQEKYELNYSTRLVIPDLDIKRSQISEKNYKLIFEKLNSAEVKELAKIEATAKKLQLKRLKLMTKKSAILSKYTRRKYTIEMMNRYGTCPIQISEEFTKLIDKLGGIPPSQDELDIMDNHLSYGLRKHYKSYKNALIAFGYAPRIRVHKRYGLIEIKSLIRLFVDSNKRLPNNRDTKRGGLPDYMTLSKYFGDWWKMKEFAFNYLAEKYPREALDYDSHFMRIRM